MSGADRMREVLEEMLKARYNPPSAAGGIADDIITRFEIEGLLGNTKNEEFSFVTTKGEIWTKEKVDNATLTERNEGIELLDDYAGPGFWVANNMLRGDAIDGFAYIVKAMREKEPV